MSVSGTGGSTNGASGSDDITAAMASFSAEAKKSAAENAEFEALQAKTSTEATISKARPDQ